MSCDSANVHLSITSIKQMMNINLTPFNEVDFSQQTTEIILKLHQVGCSPADISQSLSVSLSGVIQLLSSQVKSLKQLREMIDLYFSKSSRFRCAVTNRLIAFPVLAPDQRLFEASALVELQDANREQCLPVQFVRDEIQAFSKSTLQHICGLCFSSDATPDEVPIIAAECLSVLTLDTDIASYLQVLATVSKPTLTQLLLKLKELASIERLVGLLANLVERGDFYVQAIILIRVLLASNINDPEVLGAVFDSFTKVLTMDHFQDEILDLSLELTTKLTLAQLTHIIEVLRSIVMKPSTQLKADQLAIKIAKLKLDEGDMETARALITCLYSKPELKDSLNLFFEATGWKEEEAVFLETTFQSCIYALNSNGLAIYAEGLNTIHKLLNVKLALAADACNKLTVEADGRLELNVS